MANVLSLAMKVTGDASGLIKPMTQAEKALAGLGSAADRSLKALDTFAAGSTRAAEAQARAAADFDKLAEALKAGLDPQEYARQFAALQASTKELAAAFAEGARVTEQAKTADERRAEQLERLQRLLDVGAISEETYARASAETSGANEAAARAERERADAAAAAARIIQANLTPQERYDNQLQELNQHLRDGRLSQEQFNRAAERASQELNAAGREASGTDRQLQSLNKNVALLRNIEIGRLLIDGLQVLSSAIRSVTSQITGLVGTVNSGLDRLNDLSARTGIGVEAFQKYSVAAKLAGVDTEQFGTAVQKLAVNIGKATPGDALDKSLRSINLSVAELRQLSPEQQFSAIGQAISTLPTAADRAAASVEIFGKQGAALAPLFRDGAASIEELQARAERLGIIVSETQVNNVADMNDAFDLVRATVEGIIGQVIGNLAPAVTDVTEQFLKFVEEWSGAQGQGGGGIANAITDVLLQGAEYFAGVFDSIIPTFTGFVGNLEAVGSTFSTVSNVLKVVSEGFKVVFNTLQVTIDGLMIGLGKVIEAIGSYVSDDLEAFGKNLQEEAARSGKQNEKELIEAANNAANAVSNILNGDSSSPAAAGAGTATQYLRGLRQEIEQQRLPEVRIQSNIDQTREQFDSFFNGIVDNSSAVTEAMRDFEAAVAAAGDLTSATAEEVKAIEQAQQRVNQAISEEREQRQQALEAATKQADEDKKRVDALLQSRTEASKAEQDIAAVQREIQKAEEQLAAARQANDSASASAAAARIAQLDQVKAQLDENIQAAEQGFGDAGFGPAFQAIQSGLNAAADNAAEFGNAGALAFQRLKDGVEQAQQAARDGILTKETYDRAVAQQQELFNQQLEAAKRVEEFLASGLDERQKRELEAVKALEERRKKAELNVQAIKDQIATKEKELEAAREGKDLRAARIAQNQINQLEKAQRGEQAIIEGRQEVQRQQFAALDGNATRAQQFQQLVARSNAQFANAITGTYAAANSALAAAAEANARQERFLEQLNTLGSRTVQSADVRTQEGAALVLGFAANAQDPQLIEAKIQTKLQRQLVQGIAATLNRIGLPAYIPA